jgi:predicted DNA-binding mobile mystery protein A
MRKSASKADFQALKRRQLDERLRPLLGVNIPEPRDGWIRSVRTALGMSHDQLARRLGKTRASVTQFERNEARGAITLAKLREAADAMGCDLVIAFRPRLQTFEDTVRQQAVRKAQRLQDTVVHTMALEDQAEGVPREPTSDVDTEWWLRENLKRLWD